MANTYSQNFVLIIVSLIIDTNYLTPYNKALSMGSSLSREMRPTWVLAISPLRFNTTVNGNTA